MSKIKNKGGRPKTVLTNEQIKEVEEMSASMTIQQMADYFGMSEKTFHELKNRDFTVCTAYKKGKSSGIKEATSLLWQNMRARDNTAILFYLKTQAGWNEKQQLDVTTKDITPLPPMNIAKQKQSYEKKLLSKIDNED
jgi:AraC-like DNA-binding protein